MFKKNDPIERDERTISVEHASYSIGFNVILYALLLDIMVRSFFFHEASWDLFAIAILCPLISTLYQLKHQVLTKSWVKVSLIALVTSMVAAVIITLSARGLF